METINITVNLPEEQVTKFRQFLDDSMEVVDFRILPNTDEMYKNDIGFQHLCKAESTAKKLKGKYINDNNNKYKL